MHISITHTHTQTHTQAQAQAQARIGHTCNASLTQTQARTRTHAREPRTRTPARGRSATAGRPRRRLHPALPRQLARAAALHRSAPSWGPRFHPLAKSVGPFLFFARAKQEPFPLSLLPLRPSFPPPTPCRSPASRRSQPSAPLRPASHAPHAPAAATQDAPRQGKDVQAVGATKDDAGVVRGCRRLLLLVRRGSVPRDSPRAAAEPG